MPHLRICEKILNKNLEECTGKLLLVHHANPDAQSYPFLSHELQQRILLVALVSYISFLVNVLVVLIVLKVSRLQLLQRVFLKQQSFITMTSKTLLCSPQNINVDQETERTKRIKWIFLIFMFFYSFVRLYQLLHVIAKDASIFSSILKYAFPQYANCNVHQNQKPFKYPRSATA